MTAQRDAFKDSLARSSEITITVTGRKSGRAVSNPVWFVLDGNTLYLLPVEGSHTQWYKNLLEQATIRIKAGSSEATFAATPVNDAAQVKSVVDKFRAKYGAGDVKKYYSTTDVAVIVQIG